MREGGVYTAFPNSSRPKLLWLSLNWLLLAISLLPKCKSGGAFHKFQLVGTHEWVWPADRGSCHPEILRSTSEAEENKYGAQCRPKNSSIKHCKSTACHNTVLAGGSVEMGEESAEVMTLMKTRPLIGDCLRAYIGAEEQKLQLTVQRFALYMWTQYWGTWLLWCMHWRFITTLNIGVFCAFLPDLGSNPVWNFSCNKERSVLLSLLVQGNWSCLHPLLGSSHMTSSVMMSPLLSQGESELWLSAENGMKRVSCTLYPSFVHYGLSFWFYYINKVDFMEVWPARLSLHQDSYFHKVISGSSKAFGTHKID